MRRALYKLAVEVGEAPFWGPTHLLASTLGRAGGAPGSLLVGQERALKDIIGPNKDETQACCRADGESLPRRAA